MGKREASGGEGEGRHGVVANTRAPVSKSSFIHSSMVSASRLTLAGGRRNLASSSVAISRHSPRRPQAHVDSLRRSRSQSQSEEAHPITGTVGQDPSRREATRDGTRPPRRRRYERFALTTAVCLRVNRTGARHRGAGEHFRAMVSVASVRTERLSLRPEADDARGNIPHASNFLVSRQGGLRSRRHRR